MTAGDGKLRLRPLARDVLRAYGDHWRLIVPGVLIYTYLVISPALIEVRRLSVGAAIRESIELVRGNFWRVLLLSMVVLLGTDAVAGARPP